MANTHKVLSSVGVPVMCAEIGNVKRSANLLSDALNQAVTEIEVALNDFPVSTSIIVSSTGWQENSTDTTVTQTAYYYDIQNLDIDQYDLPVITIAPSSMDVAASCGLCSTCESFEGFVRLYAKNAPDVNITVSLFIIKGKQQSEQPEYDLSYNNEEGGE